MDSQKKSGLYLHIPFCRKKCLYCDFFSAGESLADWDGFVEALLNEASARKGDLPYPPSTIYIGGGTPSLMPSSQLSKLMKGIKERFPDSEAEEITLEANPDDVNEEKIEAWHNAGINRISIGIQSFQDEELSAVGRRHTGRQAQAALKMLRGAFENVSADLIFGLPHQTLESWKESVDLMTALAPDHISAYSLMYEEGTPLTVLQKSGRIRSVGEEESELMFKYLTERLKYSGYSRYEISNYSLPGKESRHNTMYWESAPYLGLGPSAHSYDGLKTRRWNPCDLRSYLSYFGAGYNHHIATHQDLQKEFRRETSHQFFQEEILNDEELREEFLLTRMRLAEGMDTREYAIRWGDEAKDRLLQIARRKIAEGRLAYDGINLRLTDLGVMTADNIILDLSM